MPEQKILRQLHDFSESRMNRLADNDPEHLELAMRRLQAVGIDTTQFEEQAKRAIANLSMPVITKFPILNRKDVEGLVVIRHWREFKGWLMSETMRHYWKPITIADRPPEEKNTSGLYAFQLNREGFKRYIYGYDKLQHPLGFVEFRGDLVIHTDGVIRGEFGKILHILIPATLKTVLDCYRRLSRNYPGIPITVIHPELIEEMVFFEAAVNCLKNRARELQ